MNQWKAAKMWDQDEGKNQCLGLEGWFAQHHTRLLSVDASFPWEDCALQPKKKKKQDSKAYQVHDPRLGVIYNQEELPEKSPAQPEIM